MNETIVMLLKMSAVTLGSVLLTYIVYRCLRGRPVTWGIRITIGLVYGVFSVLSTHFGVDYGEMMLNVRDLGPMSAGLFFDPVSGIIAGLIGGIERYIAGTQWGVGEFTSIACSISTCLAGFLAAFASIVIFDRKKPTVVYAFFLGAVIEVFHMYVVFITHRNEMYMAFLVVKSCCIPMILFSGIGLALSSFVLLKASGQITISYGKIPSKDIPISARFQASLFLVMVLTLALVFFANFNIQTKSAFQGSRYDIYSAAIDITETYKTVREAGGDVSILTFPIRDGGFYLISDPEGNKVVGNAFTPELDKAIIEYQDANTYEEIHFNNIKEDSLEGTDVLCICGNLYDGNRLFVAISMTAVYQTRDIQAYENLLADILLFSVIYFLISQMVERLVSDKLARVNKSLHRITGGDLDEKVEVYSCREFTSLSNDINEMVTVLKGYIAEAAKRIEQELLLARTIQSSALPTNFDLNKDNVEIYATMNPAKEVGGDFYDFFFVGHNRLALVIADVSGKGIPGALFMMHSKTSIRGQADSGAELTEIFRRVNNELCEGNDAEMFVTVWMGIVDFESGRLQCVNAGHEYPALMRNGCGFEIVREKHSPPLGTIEDLTFKEYEMQLMPGDCLFVYTDGVTEAININEEAYGEERMLAALNRNKNLPLSEMLPAVKKDIDDFAGEANQFDDITMLGFKFRNSNT